MNDKIQTDIALPDEVVEAVCKRLAAAAVSQFEARAAILAAIKAWPGMHVHEWQRPWLGGMSGSDLILPIPQETDA